VSSISVFLGEDLQSMAAATSNDTSDQATAAAAASMNTLAPASRKSSCEGAGTAAAGSGAAGATANIQVLPLEAADTALGTESGPVPSGATASGGLMPTLPSIMSYTPRDIHEALQQPVTLRVVSGHPLRTILAGVYVCCNGSLFL
jgi:hypothetical protein